MSSPETTKDSEPDEDSPSEVGLSEREEEEEQKEDKNSLEHYRLAGRKPLITILILSIGPILSQLTSSLYGVFATIWVSKSIGEAGMTAISTYTAFDNVGRSFGYFVSVAGSQTISSLFGEGRPEEAGQVICDLLRVSVLFGILVPAVLCPTVKLGVQWFGASEEIVELGYDYMLPMLVCSFFTCVFVGAGGFLQGEGKSLIYGWITIASSVANMFFLCPLFLLAFKTGIVGAGIATAISESVPAIILVILYFCGKFAVKPKVGQLLKKFSPYTLPALRVGLSQLIANLSVSLPGIVIRKLIGLSTRTTEEFDNALAGFNVITRYAAITNGLLIGLTNGFLPAASYAYAAKNYKRWIRLAIHMNWLGFTWGTITSIFSYSIPNEISKIFASSNGYLSYAGPMLTVGNALGFVVFARFTTPSMLQSMKRGITSTILSLSCQLVSIIVFAVIMYYTDKYNPTRVCWCYPLSYAFGLVVGAIVIFFPVRKMVKVIKEENEKLKNDEEEEEEDIKDHDHEEINELSEF
ncbi:MatE family protein [Histomonas meleagridis]|uniref:MatE family protein n=1 Tax=Histomonas meleagridis TaxID=135588 RepID=UPI00355A40FD|nr:MatE family protein [Histomonas meleagridis]KAH0806643.1 MatE family protein [Histomonas meleagridis]